MLSPAGGTPVGGRPVGRKMMGFVLLLFALVSTAVARGQAQAPPVVLSGLQVQPAPADIPTITYRRVFQGSTPEFIEIKVQQDGAALADLRRLSEEAAPQAFEVGPAVRVYSVGLAAVGPLWSRC